MSLCPLCKNEILVGEDKFMLAHDFPYFNVYMHQSCYRTIKMQHSEWILENIDLLESIYNNTPTAGKKKKLGI